jgi:2-furoyl-CoA dehydrogenase large subunit
MDAQVTHPRRRRVSETKHDNAKNPPGRPGGSSLLPTDRINTSLTYGFVFDMCGVEVDPVTFQVRIDRYVSMHDAGTLLNPLIADGQVHGAFAQGVAAALYEEFVYDEAGSFLSSTFADYLVPTASEIPQLEILHQETPSPLTPLGAKGLAEGNCMSTPACIANAVADALGVKDIALPLTPRRLHGLIAGAEPPRPAGARVARIELPAQTSREGRTLRGNGSFEVAAPPAAVWRALLDPDSLKAVIPAATTCARPERTTTWPRCRWGSVRCAGASPRPSACPIW